jgi:transcriptional regulator with XRE-family HTH domain
LIFGQRLKELRQQLNLSQQEMADHLCISQSSYSRIENGKSLVAASFITQVAYTFQVSADWLLDITLSSPANRLQKSTLS